MNIKRLTVDSICLAILIVSAYISIPVTEIAFTLQMLVVLLLAFLLPISDAILIIVIYIVAGLLGLPIFSNFRGGLSYLFNPSFGYLLGFILVPIIVKINSYLEIKNTYLKNSIVCLISTICLYLFSMCYFYIIQTLYLEDTFFTFKEIFLITVLPFIPFDLIKIVITVILIDKIKPILKAEGIYGNNQI